MPSLSSLVIDVKEGKPTALFCSISKIKTRKMRNFENMAQVQPRPSFGSTPGSIDSYDHRTAKLFIELGPRHFASFVTSAAADKVMEYEFFHLDEKISASDLSEYIIDRNFNLNDFQSVTFVHNQKEFVLVPSEFHKSHLDKSVLETIHGDLDHFEIQSDDLSQWEIVNVFGIDASTFESIQQLFPNAGHVHINTIYLKSIFKQLAEMQEQWLKVYFYPSFFNVVIFKDSQLQIMQSFYYETQDDVIYFLLTLTDQLGLDVTSVFMQLSGLIEEESATYKEIKKYFLNVSLEKNIDSNTLLPEDQDQPAHYFTPLFLPAQCV
jgi:hypothetical protein